MAAQLALVIAVIGAGAYFAARPGCDAATDNRKREDLFNDIILYFDQLTQKNEFVELHSGWYRFWPRGRIGTFSYPGDFATYIKPDRTQKSFTLMAYKQDQKSRKWSKSGDTVSMTAHRLFDSIGAYMGTPIENNQVKATILSYPQQKYLCGIKVQTGK